MRPVQIPATSPALYISFKHALNLRYPTEDTGDWHFLPMFFQSDDETKLRSACLAGEGERVNTNLSLGEHGVRDMAQIVEDQGILKNTGPVYVANHYRAITDLAMLHLEKGMKPTIAAPSEINAWLDTEEQVNTLVTEYLIPLRSQLTGASLEAYEDWMPTVYYE